MPLKNLSGQKLSLCGGEKTVKLPQEEIFAWPIITSEHEEAVLQVLRSGKMSDINVTKEFEKEYARSLGRKYALAYHNGTAAILGGLYGLGIGVGDQVIVPSITFWASVVQLYALGASPIFADIDPDTLCLDPADIERRITLKTKAIIVVHYSAMPADMDAILEIAGRHNLKVLEDCSHAHGALYKGKEVGTFGDVGAFSLMSGKSLAIGEGGILLTDDQKVFEKALLFGHYIRHNQIELEELKPNIGLPCGGYKHRIHQLSSAVGRVQLKRYPEQMAQIDKAMNYFCDLLDGTPGLRPMRPAKGSGSTKGGWYYPLCRYVSKELGGLSMPRFCQAVRAEGSFCNPGCNKPLHLHPLFYQMDVYGHGKPTRIAHLEKDVIPSQLPESLPVSEGITKYMFEFPWFKQYLPKVIEEHAQAYRKVAANYESLLADDQEPEQDMGGYTSFFSEQKNR